MGVMVDWFCLRFSSLAGLNSAKPASLSTLSTMSSIFVAISINKDTNVASGRTFMRGGMVVFMPGSPFAVSGGGTGSVLGRDVMAFWRSCAADCISPTKKSILDDLLMAFMVIINSFRTLEEQELRIMQTSCK